jgi:hypothetical protein
MSGPWELCDKCADPIPPDAPWFLTRHASGAEFVLCLFCRLKAKGVAVDKANEICLREEKVRKMEASLRGEG